MIDLDLARAKAAEMAHTCLSGLVRSTPKVWLREGHLEAENCWLFLKVKDLDFLPNCAQSADMAFVVSKKGRMMSVADHHEDMSALTDYLNQVSEYLGQRGE